MVDQPRHVGIRRYQMNDSHVTTWFGSATHLVRSIGSTEAKGSFIQVGVYAMLDSNSEALIKDEQLKKKCKTYQFHVGTFGGGPVSRLG